MTDGLRELQTGIRTFTMAYLAMLLDEPNTVDMSIDATQTIIKIVIKFTNPVDCAKMVGSEGRTINGYRRLIYGVATKHGIPKVLVIIVDPDGQSSGDHPDNYRKSSKRTQRHDTEGKAA